MSKKVVECSKTQIQVESNVLTKKVHHNFFENL